MTGKSGLILLVLASWIGPLAPAAPLTPGGDRFACSVSAPPACQIAQSSLVEAEAAVQTATARKALWSTAAEALRDAEGAFAQGDYQAAQRAADTAIQQAQLGIAQTAYPMFPFPRY
jgi:hypothetical protein